MEQNINYIAIGKRIRQYRLLKHLTQENKMVDIEKYCDYLKKQLKEIDPDILDFITDDMIKEFVKAQIKCQKENGSGGFSGGFGGFSNPTPGQITRTFSEATKNSRERGCGIKRR